MTKPMEPKPATVSDTTKQAGEIRARWAWVEPQVWTDRMLTALENGVKGGKWFSLMDKICSVRNLRKAFTRVKANKGAAGVDHQTIEMFENHLDENLEKLSLGLKDGTYRPKAVRRRWIPKPGSKEQRPLGIPTVRDRVVQGAMRSVLEPIFERDFAEQSYGFRPRRGCKDALRRVKALLDAGYTWVVDADIKSYFDTIPHQPLLKRMSAKVADGMVLSLVDRYLKQSVMETAQGWTPDEGTPQGAVISPLLSNIYLDPLDHKMLELGFEMLRYADDFVVLCRSEPEANRALEEVAKWTSSAGLKLHQDKTRIVDVAHCGGFDFLGYHFEQGRHRPSRKSLRKFKDTIRSKTRRSNGNSLQTIISDVNRTLVGRFGYFKHSHIHTFSSLDSWLRMRPRSILRKRRGGKRRGRGRDHHRWPNAFFAGQGLFSLTAAHAEACQSSRR